MFLYLGYRRSRNTAASLELHKAAVCRGPTVHASHVCIPACKRCKVRHFLLIVFICVCSYFHSVCNSLEECACADCVCASYCYMCFICMCRLEECGVPGGDAALASDIAAVTAYFCEKRQASTIHPPRCMYCSALVLTYNLTLSLLRMYSSCDSHCYAGLGMLHRRRHRLLLRDRTGKQAHVFGTRQHTHIARRSQTVIPLD
jgi:hypothetical protein